MPPINQLEELKNKYTLDREVLDKVLYDILRNEVGKLIPEENPIAVLIVAQDGVKQQEIETAIKERFNKNICHITREMIYKYIPFADEIRLNYPNLFGELTAKIVDECKIGLERYCRMNRYNLLLNSNLVKPEIEDRLKSLKRAGYKIEFNVLAVNNKVSELSIIYNSEIKGRISVNLSVHDESYEKLPSFINYYKKEKIFDQYKLYRSDLTENIKFITDLADVNIYKSEREQISEKELKRLNELLDSIVSLKRNRNVTEPLIKHFESDNRKFLKKYEAKAEIQKQKLFKLKM